MSYTDMKKHHVPNVFVKMYLVKMFKFCLTASGFPFLCFLALSKPSFQWHDHRQNETNLSGRFPIKISKCWNISALVKLHFCAHIFVTRFITECCSWVFFGIFHTQRAVIAQDPIFWAPHSWKDLRDLSIRVWYSAVPSVSIQCLAPERNLWCQIKHQSFLGSAGVLRWISCCLARQGQDAHTAQQEMMRRGMQQRASSLRGPLLGPQAVRWAGKSISILLNRDTWLTPSNQQGMAEHHLGTLAVHNYLSGLSSVEKKAQTSENLTWNVT